MKLAIADPPYPPMFGERRDRVDGPLRVYSRSRALRWYGEGPRSASDVPAADFHSAAGDWDDLNEHRALMADLIEAFDGWAIATTPDGLGAYYPLPVSARVMVWHRPTAMPGGGRIVSKWEAVIVFVPEGRRNRNDGELVPDVLTAVAPRGNFVGSKPATWTRWVLAALGYDPSTDTVEDLFPGSGAVSTASDGMLL